MFTLYLLPLGHVLHFDELLCHLTATPMIDTMMSVEWVLFPKICLNANKDWTAYKLLQLDTDNTEVLVIGADRILTGSPPPPNLDDSRQTLRYKLLLFTPQKYCPVKPNASQKDSWTTAYPKPHLLPPGLLQLIIYLLQHCSSFSPTAGAECSSKTSHKHPP